MEAKEVSQGRKVKVERIGQDDLVKLFSGWVHGPRRMRGNEHDYSEFTRIDVDGPPWKFILETRIGSPGYAKLYCGPEIKAQLAGITQVSIGKDRGISFVSSDHSSYAISSGGLKHTLREKSDPQTTVTIDIPKSTK